ncbi:DNA internalization-related competence protein ComEC/Rec2 [Alkalihalobacillus deserti]|uniref:DNA internalization-related competence protein ComEC/Rec2 n=1 Tax=Alkalihalobacillus deserti TaxID=2879466 RepID=UPI001D13FCDF|nr:DNA internalization-related competence protein ComEC/Rec2 [Alkalihalobacillus deserti]
MRKISRFLFLIPLSATLGLFLALGGSSPLYFILLILFLFFCFIHRSFFKEKLVIITIPFLLYYLVGYVAVSQQLTAYDEGNQTIYGVVKTTPNIDGDTMSLRLQSNLNELIQVQALLYDQSDQIRLKQLSPGDTCMINGNLTSPLPPTNFSEFNYQKYLREQNIFWVLRPERGGIQCIETTGNLFLALQRWRHTQIRKVEQQVHPEFNGIMVALVFGDRTFIDGEVLEAYQRLGIIHLLAVSGLHVGMIVTMLFYSLIRVGITRERVIEILLFILPLYMIIAGAAPSVIRASIMAMVVLVCLRFKKRVSPLTGISSVYLGYLFIKPFALFHLGFQLSFLISFGLIISIPMIQKRYPNRYIQLLSVTLLSQVLSFPLLLLHMFELSMLAIPLNLIYIPIITVFVLPLTLLSFMLSFFISSAFNYPLLLLEFIFPFIHELLRKSAEFRFSSFVVGKPSMLLVFAYYLCVFFGCLMWEKGTRGWWIKPMAILSILLIVQVSSPYVDSRTKVTMIDVGQGDSILIEFPFRKAIYLIDTGGTISFSDEDWRKRRKPFEVGADVVVPTLKARGINQIDRLILTHGHLDHIGGAMALSKAFNIKEVNYSQGVVEGEFERELLTEFARKQTKIRFVKEGVSWKDAGATFVVLSPSGMEQGLNERSIVLVLEVEGINFLFTGDLEESGERRLISTYPNLQIDVLKAGHHGSRTSTTEAFLNHINPRLVLISAGRRNRFGHPHPEVVERIEDRGIPLLRSDLEGAIELTIEKQKIEVKTALEQ